MRIFHILDLDGIKNEGSYKNAIQGVDSSSKSFDLGRHSHEV